MSGRLGDPAAWTGATLRPSWVPSPLARRLATLAAVSLAAALITRNPALVAFAAPAAVALSVWLRERGADSVRVEAELPEPRLLEHVPGQVTATARVGDPAVAGEAVRVGSWQLAWRPEHGLSAADDVHVGLGDEAHGSWRLTAPRWGYYDTGAAVVTARTPRRGWSATLVLPGPGLTVYPPAPDAPRVPAPPHLQSRLGPHVSRAAGAGIEFAGIRPYLPGDPVRRVNWLLSNRHGDLMTNEYAQERQADVVVLIDSVHDVGVPGETTVDVSVRGATAVVRAYLSVADRVGVVAFGSTLRWLTPATGNRHFYRIIETLLQSRQSRTFVDPSIDRLPLAVLPSGAMVVCFTPLLDEVSIEAIRDLRERAHPVVVVDVLGDEDFAVRDDTDRLARTIWRLEREALVDSLQRIGVRVVSHSEVAGGSLGWLQLTAAGTGYRR